MKLINKEDEKPPKDPATAQLESVLAATKHKEAVKAQEALRDRAAAARANSEALGAQLREADVAEHDARKAAAEAEQEHLRAMHHAAVYQNSQT